VFSVHGESHLTDSKTELSSSSPPPVPERTNTNCSLNMQTEKDVKEPISAPAQCSARTGLLLLKALEHRISLFLLLYRQIHTELCQHTRLGEYH